MGQDFNWLLSTAMIVFRAFWVVNNLWRQKQCLDLVLKWLRSALVGTQYSGKRLKWITKINENLDEWAKQFHYSPTTYLDQHAEKENDVAEELEKNSQIIICQTGY